MADFTVSTDVDALMRSADNAAIKTQLGIPSPEAILNPLVEGQGLLNSFTGSAAAYSLRDLNKTNPDVVEVRRASDETSRVFKANEIGSTLENWVNAEVALPLDTASGAAAAYSLRDLSVSRADLTSSGDTGGETTGALVAQVRRSSDDEIKSFTAADVAGTALTDWVNTSYTDSLNGSWSLGSSNTAFSSNTSSGNQITATASSTAGTAGARLLYSFGSNYVAKVGTTITATFNVTSVTGSILIKQAFQAFPSTASTGASITINSTGTFTYTDTVTTSNSAYTYGLAVIFDADESLDATLTSLTVDGDVIDGHVVTWYDQSGNANHAVQTTEASQPKIVDAGTLVAEGLKFDGVNDRLDTSTTLTAPFNTFFTGKMYDVTQRGNFWDAAQSTDRVLHSWRPDAGQGVRLQSVSAPSGNLSDTNTGLFTNNQQFVLTSLLNGASSSIIKDGSVVVTGDSGSGTLSNFVIGSDKDKAVVFNGTISEVIIYNSDQSDNRKAIESNMADYHGNIDLPAGFDSGNNEVDGFVATWYDQSGNGNNATQPVSTSQPKIVDAGVLVADGIQFDGVNDSLSRSISLTQPCSLFANYKALAGNSYVVGGDTNGVSVGRRGNNEYIISAGVSLASATHPSTSVISSSFFDGSSSEGYWNGSLLVSGDAGSNTEIESIGRIGVVFFNGTISEILIYNSDQTAFRTNIEFNINNAYSIY